MMWSKVGYVSLYLLPKDVMETNGLPAEESNPAEALFDSFLYEGMLEFVA